MQVLIIRKIIGYKQYRLITKIRRVKRKCLTIFLVGLDFSMLSIMHLVALAFSEKPTDMVKLVHGQTINNIF